MDSIIARRSSGWDRAPDPLVLPTVWGPRVRGGRKPLLSGLVFRKLRQPLAWQLMRDRTGLLQQRLVATTLPKDKDQQAGGRQDDHATKIPVDHATKMGREGSDGRDLGQEPHKPPRKAQ